MIQPAALFSSLRSRGIGLFAGVPDSLLASFCAYVEDHSGENGHVITANEGNAVALACGYHLATNGVAAVYLQNSGLGNTINPLASLADEKVYGIPVLLIIGWRGEPGVPDEPQHVKQGRISLEQLRLLEIPAWVLDRDSDYERVLDDVFAELEVRGAPVALLVRAGTFADYTSRRAPDWPYALSRESALRIILAGTSDKDLVVCTTGKASREVFEFRAERGERQQDFLTVGSMGHASSIALGVALAKPDRRVVCLDGDGAMLMHMGSMAVIGSLKPRNLVHVVLNNAAHESVGGQPTVAGKLDCEAIARACGYETYLLAATEAETQELWKTAAASLGPVLLEVRIGVGSRKNLGRPTIAPRENKAAFMVNALR